MPERSRESFPNWFKWVFGGLVGVLLLYGIWAFVLLRQYGMEGFAAGVGLAFWLIGLFLVVLKIGVLIKVLSDTLGDAEDQHYSKNIKK